MEPVVQAMEHGLDARLVPEREPLSNEPETLINPPTQNTGPGFRTQGALDDDQSQDHAVPENSPPPRSRKFDVARSGVAVETNTPGAGCPGLSAAVNPEKLHARSGMSPLNLTSNVAYLVGSWNASDCSVSQ